MDGIKCHSAIVLGLMLFDIWIQISVLADLIKDVIDTSVVYLISAVCSLTDLHLAHCATYFCGGVGVTSW